ncbi:hypothetical protein BT96DRAFT_1025784 [Gymnopus androsaceus JB14]|uniref:F-box domain-containing protein n=1 Tax=Gymnopus androsaceus JB14 TaxID=1447944 RepID=A0A6A4GR80_9AGAR|nr:hypothetical protein BT96DRAFT_1025784 [Gymnopus androsaceus JB14]
MTSNCSDRMAVLVLEYNIPNAHSIEAFLYFPHTSSYHHYPVVNDQRTIYFLEMKLTIRIPDRRLPSGPREGTVPLAPVTPSNRPCKLVMQEMSRLTEEHGSRNERWKGAQATASRRHSLQIQVSSCCTNETPPSHTECENSDRDRVARRMSLYNPQDVNPSPSTNGIRRSASLRTLRESRAQPRVLVFARQAPRSRQSKSPSSQNHRLPIEILTEVFLHCVPTNYDTPPVCLAREAPLVLTSICREWRLVALNTPRLWCFPRFRLPQPTSMAAEGSARQQIGIELWLKRSGSLPLSLSLCPSRFGFENDISNSEPNHNAFRVLRSILQHCYRIVELTIFSLRGMHDLLRYMSVTKIRLPALQTIYIPVAGERTCEVNDRLLSDLMTQSQLMMPGLQKIGIDGLSPDTTRYLNRTRSWSPNVTHLILGSLPSSRRRPLNGQRLGPAELLSILLRNPQLRSFEGVITLNSIQSIYRTPQLSTVVVNLPALHNLKIRFEVPSNDAFTPYPDPDMFHLFKGMACPSLKTLSVAYAGLPSLVEVPFIPWLRSTDGTGSRHTLGVEKLRKLHLELSMTPEALTQCLVLLPQSLRVLEIVDLGQLTTEFVAEYEGVMFGHTVQDSHLELLTWRLPSYCDEDYRTYSSSFSDGINRNVCPRLKTFRLTVSAFLALGASIPSGSRLSPVQRQGISQAVLQRFVDSRMSRELHDLDNNVGNSRKLRECEVLLSPSSSSYYKFF